MQKCNLGKLELIRRLSRSQLDIAYTRMDKWLFPLVFLHLAYGGFHFSGAAEPGGWGGGNSVHQLSALPLLPHDLNIKIAT